MQFKLSDGRSFYIKDIREVTAIRDYGSDGTTIDLSKLGFTIYLKGGKSLLVVEYYHFADWAMAKQKLSDLRDDIMKAWQPNT